MTKPENIYQNSSPPQLADDRSRFTRGYEPPRCVDPEIECLKQRLAVMTTRAKKMQHCLEMAATGAASTGQTAFAALLLEAAGEPIA